MYAWLPPFVPALEAEAPALNLYDTADRAVRPVETEQQPVGIYVCGITPYDATHLGHAATYLLFDLIVRQLKAAGHEVTLVENITDVDDPLFERAERDGVDWRELGQEQIDLFRSDMAALRVIPPTHFVPVTTIIDKVVDLVGKLIDKGYAYEIDNDGYRDIYASIEATSRFGYESGLTYEQMAPLFAARGGDPDTPGKHHSMDALVWKGARPGEPHWEAPFGAGRPGWHIECAAIALDILGPHFAIQGGGKDLVFPHHEFTAAHVEAATDTERMAGHYVHVGMIGLDGVKMSKSLGNLVFVSKLLADGVSPSAIRIALFSQPYATDRDFSHAAMAEATKRLATWKKAARSATDQSAAQQLVDEITAALANNIDTPRAFAAIDAWAGDPEGSVTGPLTPAGQIVATALDALMGILLDDSVAYCLSDLIGEFTSDLSVFASGGYLTDTDKQLWIAPYDPGLVDEMRDILCDYAARLDALDHPASSHDILACLRETQSQLKDLNELSAGALIEIEEHEDLATILAAGALTAGLSQPELDGLDLFGEGLLGSA